MELPNYFLADLPRDTELPPSLVREACQTLRRNRERYLLTRPTESLLEVLAEVGRVWQGPGSGWKRLALDQGPALTGWSAPMLEAGLDQFFRRLTPRRLGSWMVQDLGHVRRLDGLMANDAEGLSGVETTALGPELLVQILPDGPPESTLLPVIRGLLVRAAQFVKCAPGNAFLCRLLAHSLREVDPKLASCLEVAEWVGGREDLETPLFEEADTVTLTGRTATVEAVQRRLPSSVRFLSCGERWSAGYVAREMLGSQEETATVEAAAMDVVWWDQRGCLAPQTLFVEMGGMLPPEAFAARLAEALAGWEQRWPRLAGHPREEAELTELREMYRLRADRDGRTQCWFSEGSPAWSVVYEADPGMQVSNGHRFIQVRGVETLEEVLRQAEPYRRCWSTTGLAARGVRRSELASQWAAWGAPRICPLGRMQTPPLEWREQGRPVLGDLVRWVHHELPADP